MNFHLSHGSKPNILIVDDTPNNLRVLSVILGNNGYEVRKAINGEMAFQSIKTQPPNLIILDIKMPGMNGYETCEMIKKDSNFNCIPIIFISALNDIKDKVKAFEVGGVDYITKPFHQEEVLARVENQIRIQRLKNELEKKNESLNKVNQELADSNQRLNEFAHVVSHDLKQPVQGIMGFSNLILMQYESILNDSVIHYINRIHQAGERMQGLIHDLLDFAQLEASDRPFVPIDCTAIITRVMEDFQGQIKESHAQISCELLPTIMGYETHLIQLFQNLIGNALKYAHPDRPLHIQITSDLTSEGIKIKIQDNGIGIAPELLPKIFDPFQRAHQGDYDGNGIGLATCKKILELHHGTIAVISELGEGSAFTLTFPSVS